MAGEPERLSGALAGWRRHDRPDGIIVELEIGRSAEDFRDRRFQLVQISLNNRQLRSFARDLVRASERRDIELFSKPTLLGRLRRLVRRS